MPADTPLDSIAWLTKGPLFERSRLFEHGRTFDPTAVDLSSVALRGLGRTEVGWWECELPDNQLVWTTGVYDIFRLPHLARVTREEALGYYAEPSRAALERLRSESIARSRGFLLDAKIRRASGGETWMRLIGAPLIERGQVIALHGLKLRL